MAADRNDGNLGRYDAGGIRADGNLAMTGLALPESSCRRMRLSLAVAAVSCLCMFLPQARAAALDDVLQQALNHVFTSSTDPQNGPDIVARTPSVGTVPAAKLKRYATHHLTRLH